MILVSKIRPHLLSAAKLAGKQVYYSEGAVPIAIVLLAFYSLAIVAMIAFWRYDIKIRHEVGTVHFKVSKRYQLALCEFSIRQPSATA